MESFLLQVKSRAVLKIRFLYAAHVLCVYTLLSKSTDTRR